MVVKNAAVNVVLGVLVSLVYSGSVQAAVSYAPPTSTTADSVVVNSGPEFIEKGHLNGDGNIDLVSVNTTGGSVTVLLSNGAGGFSSVTRYDVGSQPRQVAIGDLDGINGNDLVVPNNASGNVSVLLNNGDGTFTEVPSRINIIALAGAGAEPTSPVIADLDGDTIPDLAISNDFPDGTTGITTDNVQILHGVGNGTFTSTAGGVDTITVGNKPISLAAGDVNWPADGVTDLVVGNYDDDTVSVLLGNGDGTFTSAPGSPFASGNKPWFVQIASIDSLTDAIPDIALVNYSSPPSTVQVFKGVGNGSFTSLYSRAVANRPHSMEIADLDGGGVPDLLVASDNSGVSPVAAVTVLLGDGAGAFPTVAQYPISTDPVNGDRPNSVVSANLDNANQLDLAVANGITGKVDVLLNVLTANPPVASDDTLAVTEDTATTGTLTATDADGALLNYSIVSNGTMGTAVITDAATGAYTYTPNANENGGDTFTFKANDGTADSNTATITVTIAAVNDAPTISGSPATKAVHNTAYSFTPGGGDVDGDTLTYSIINKPTWASFSTTTGALTGTPTNANFGTTTAGIVISVSDGIAAPVSLAAFNLKVVGVVNVTASDATATEAGRTTGRFTFTRTGSTAAALTVNYSVGGTARAGRDYLSLGGRITFPIGVRTVTRTVKPIDDTLQEFKESVILRLSQSPNYAVGSARRASVILTSNETVTRVITVAASDATATEAGRTTGRFTFTRTGSTAAALTVNYIVRGTATAGRDYTSLGSRITFPIGARTVTRIVKPINDTLQELNETVILSLSQNPNYAVRYASSRATVTVTSND